MSFLLDRFPLDILFRIFDYLWAHEIICSFLNISNHVNNILSDYKKYKINFESISKSSFDLVCRYMRPEQAISLRLSDKNDTPNQSELFGSLFSIEQFTHLRSLKLIELDNDDGELFLTELNKLKHLISLEINVKIHVPFLVIPPSLQRLIININPKTHFDIGPAIAAVQFHNLRHVSLSNCSCKILQKIFSQAVQLTSLKISLAFFNPQEIDTLMNIHKKQTTISSLISLSLFLEGAGFLTLFQSLKQLELIISMGADHQLIDACQWEKFINKYLSKLVTFNFKFGCWRFDEDIINQYRCPFWINKHWYAACDSDCRSLFTVPYFARSSMSSSWEPISSNHTTLPIEQRSLFYDSITQFTLESDQDQLPYRYDYVKKLYLESSYIRENILDLSKVQTLVVKTHEWSLKKLLILIKQKMPSVNNLNLNFPYSNIRDKDLTNISLEQIRILSLPNYEMIKGTDSINWSRLFPCVQRLISSINSKNQIKHLLHQFKHLLSAYFYLDIIYSDRKDKIDITDQWLKKHINLGRENKINNFISNIENRYSFSICLWINEHNQINCM